MADQSAAVTRDDALAFADEAFRNRDIVFSHRDVVDMVGALGTFLSCRCLASVSSASAETLALQAIKAVTATAKDGAAGLSRIMAITNSAGVHAPYGDLLQDPAVALIVERPRTEWAHLFKPDAKGCAIPPEGWQCSRARGHAGPCAASPEPVPATNQAGEVERAILDAWLTDVQRAAINGAIHVSGDWVLTTQYEDDPGIIEDLPESIADPVSGILTPLGEMIRAALVSEKPQ